MEKNKYYVPKIEEFHLGFEYEYMVSKNEFNKIYYDGQVIKSDYYFDDYGCPFDSIEEEINNRKIRTKYLDKDDIEEFGFIHKVTASNRNSFYKGAYDLSLYTLENDKYNLYISDNSGILFYGCIKNKSEFKRLLQWLKIIE